jgi:DNA-binding NtrC family response regulator
MAESPKILIIDDEEEFLRGASFTLRISGYPNVETCLNGSGALDRIGAGDFSLVMLDIMMPDVSGRELLPKIKSLYPEVQVVMCTAVNEIEVAVECVKAGAVDYLLKPIDKARLVTTISNIVQYKELEMENKRLTLSLLDKTLRAPDAFSAIITENEAMRTMFRYIEAIAPTSMPVLIAGETGAGKELVARAVHNASKRKGPFVPVNVAGLDDSLFSDTLFGHERGAFTGADRRREGLIAKASGGTLFLDEIGDLKKESQVKLLRLIEERSYYPVGSDSLRTTDCRIVVATNAQLESLVSENAFRKDLYFRLGSHRVAVAPLRQRKDDIAALTNHFLKTASAELNKQLPTPPPQLFSLLKNYSFPGNVRELRGMVYDAVSQHAGHVLSMDVFKRHIDENRDFSMVEASFSPENPHQTEKISFGEDLPNLKDLEIALMTEALKRCDNNQSQAARLLGITPSALNKRLNK